MTDFAVIPVEQLLRRGGQEIGKCTLSYCVGDRKYCAVEGKIVNDPGCDRDIFKCHTYGALERAAALTEKKKYLEDVFKDEIDKLQKTLGAINQECYRI